MSFNIERVLAYLEVVAPSSTGILLLITHHLLAQGILSSYYLNAKCRYGTISTLTIENAETKFRFCSPLYSSVCN